MDGRRVRPDGSLAPPRIGAGNASRSAVNRIFALTLVAAAVAAPALAAEDFYETRLRIGQNVLRAQRPLDAIPDLRIAAFGFLDRPPLLCEALVCLAIAQERAGKIEDQRSTLARFVEVERRLGVFAKAPIPPDLRAEFVRLAERRIPAPTLASIPALASAARERPTAPTPPRMARQAQPPPARVTPGAAEPSHPAAPAAAQGTDNATSPADAVDVPPRSKTLTRAVYPPAAARAGVGGTVLLRVLVSEAGVPLQVEVVQGIRADLAEAAIAAVQRWTFEPARRGGRNVSAWTTVAIPFQP